MFRARIAASEKTEPGFETDALRRRAIAAGLSDSDIRVMLAEVNAALEVLIEQGQALRANGSHMTVEKMIAGTGYKVQIQFQTGGSSTGFLGRLRRALGF